MKRPDGDSWHRLANEVMDERETFLRNVRKHQRLAQAYLDLIPLTTESLEYLLENHEDEDLEQTLKQWKSDDEHQKGSNA